MPAPVKFLLTTTLWFLTASQGLLSQDADTTTAEPVKKVGYVASYWHNGLALAASPLKWKGDDWAKAGGTIIITSLTILMDDAVTQPFFDWKTSTGKAVGDVGYFIGNVPTQLGISAAALGVGALAHNKPLQYFALDNFQAQVYTGGITWLVKEIAHRARPRDNEDPLTWYGPFEGGKNESFFSGHSSIAFSTATMVFLHSKKKWWVGLVSYGIATGVSVSRLQRQAHWASDVIMGAVVGSAISSFVYKQQERRRNPSGKPKLKIIP